MGKTYIGDIGTVLRTTLLSVTGSAVDLSTATDAIYYVIKPDLTVTEWACTIDTPSTAGVISYTTIEDDWDQVGFYKYQPKITFEDADVFHGNTQYVKVYNLGEV